MLRGKRCTAYPAVGPAVRAVGAAWVAPDPIDLAVTDGARAAAWPVFFRWLLFLCFMVLVSVLYDYLMVTIALAATHRARARASRRRRRRFAVIHSILLCTSAVPVLVPAPAPVRF